MPNFIKYEKSRFFFFQLTLLKHCEPCLLHLYTDVLHFSQLGFQKLAVLQVAFLKTLQAFGAYG